MMRVRGLDSSTQKRVRMSAASVDATASAIAEAGFYSVLPASRRFFIQAKPAHEAHSQRELLEAMSPQLRGEIANLTFGRQVRAVWSAGVVCFS